MKDRMLFKLQDQRGAGIALVAITMVMLLSCVALAIDVGMMMATRTEAQRLADAAAHAGAAKLRDTNGDSALAHQEAMSWGGNNTVLGSGISILEEDVDVLPDEWTVRVRAYRTAARGSAVPTYFARVFGVDAVDIVADAAAWAAPANTAGGEGTDCLLPLALVDEWEELSQPPNGVFDPGVDQYNPDLGLGGYDENDHGKLIKLKIHSNDEETGPPACQGDATDPRVSNDIDYCQDGGDSSAWRCWWRESDPAGGGTDVLGPWIYPGENCPSMSVGDTVWGASGSGNKQSLVSNDDNDNHFEALIQSDPNLQWCESCSDGNGCVEDTANPGVCFEGDSYRIREAPVVDPTIDGEGGHTHSVINDLIGVFVEQVSCSYDAGAFGGPEGRWNVYIRLIIGAGSGSTGEGGASESSLSRNIQIIE